MAFEKPNIQTPTTVRKLVVILTDRLEWDGEPGSQGAHYSLDVRDQDGQPLHFANDRGNLVPHLTTAQITALQSFMTGLREQAETQILV